MKIYRLADMKEMTEELDQMEKVKDQLTPQEIQDFEKGMDEQMKAMTPQQRDELKAILNEQKNTNVPGTPNNTTMPAVEQMQQKPKNKYETAPTNLSREQREVFSPVETLFKSKFPEMAPDIRDQKGKVVMNDLFNTLTDGNQAELTKNLNQMKPILNKYKTKEDSVEKRRE